jgi:sulfite exporter TauE/SafE
MDDEWITPSEILLGGPPWGTTPYNILSHYFALSCSWASPPFWNPRMKEKMEKVMADLKDHSSEIDKIYTLGVVDGFSEECFPCKQFQLMSFWFLISSKF